MEARDITRRQLLALLDEVSSAPGEWVSVYLRPASVRRRQERPVLESRVDQRLLHIASVIEDDTVQKVTERFGTGLVVLHSALATYAIVPPFGVAADSMHTGNPDVQPLRNDLERPKRTFLVLVTWNAYVLALFEGDALLQHKKGTGHIHAPHKKGGSSQARFARRTQNQRSEFLRRIGGHIDAIFGNEIVEHIFFGGNRLILRPLMEESRFLRDHASPVSPRVLPLKHATLDTLEGALSDAYSGVLLQT